MEGAYGGDADARLRDATSKFVVGVGIVVARVCLVTRTPAPVDGLKLEGEGDTLDGEGEGARRCPKPLFTGSDLTPALGGVRCRGARRAAAEPGIAIGELVALPKCGISEEEVADRNWWGALTRACCGIRDFEGVVMLLGEYRALDVFATVGELPRSIARPLRLGGACRPLGSAGDGADRGTLGDGDGM